MLTGHPRGLHARELYDMDALDQADVVVEIHAPKNLDTITPSFVQGLFAGSLTSLGLDRLKSKYVVSSLPKILQDDFETGIQRLMLHRSDADSRP